LKSAYGNAFVTKMNWDASTFTLSLVYSTYLGGSGSSGGVTRAMASLWIPPATLT
jgi:hypothetical protein